MLNGGRCPPCSAAKVAPKFKHIYTQLFLSGILFNMKNNKDVFNVSFEDFDVLVIEASKQRPILTDLWAQWCPPCHVVAPALEKVVADYNGAIALAKVEVDEGENMKIAGRYQVRGFPTVILFQNGGEKARFSGSKSIVWIHEFIENNI
jgi:thioredoxin 1